MNTETILRLLRNADFRGLGIDGNFIVMEDPTCILRSFETFAEYIWVIISILTGFLLMGWGLSLVRGAKTDLMTNIRNLFWIFAALSIAPVAMNAIYGGDIFAMGCRQIRVPIAEVKEMLDARNSKLKEYNPDDLYEEFDIYDSGANENAPTVMPMDGAQSVQSTQSAAQNTSGAGNNTRTTSTDTTATTAHEPAGTRDVIYTNPDGTQYRRSGGTRAWRNKNPGNLRDTPFSRRMGAIGRAGEFAVFPDEESGRRALNELLRTDTYQNLTIAGAISRYAPPRENNTAGYHRKIEKLTGLSINRRMQDLSDAELARVADAIGQIEGWTVGTTQHITPGE